MNLPKEFNMVNASWECHRCGRINAPFNPSCFCKPEDGDIENSAKIPPSAHTNDAFNYLKGVPVDDIERIVNGIRRTNEIIQKEMLVAYSK